MIKTPALYFERNTGVCIYFLSKLIEVYILSTKVDMCSSFEIYWCVITSFRNCVRVLRNDQV